MADVIDRTADRMQAEEAFAVNAICQQARNIPKGEPGECFYCGEFFARVVEVIDPATEDTVCSCGRCRDKRKL